MPTVCIIKSRKYPLKKKDIIDGGTLNTYVIASELLRRGYSIEVFTRKEKKENDIVNHLGLSVFHVPFKRSTRKNVLLRDYEEGKSFVKGVISHSAFKPKKYACIHTHHWTSGVSIAPSLPKQIRLIHTPHLLAHEKAYYNGLVLPSCVEIAERSLLNRANFIITLSKNEQTVIQEKYDCPYSKIVVAPNGINNNFFDVPPLDTSTKIFSILFVGRLCRQKGIDVLLDSIEQITKDNIPISAQLLGESYGELEFDELLERRIHRAPLASIVNHINGVAHDRMPSFMNKGFVYVQPSRYESQGVALLEAMASGRVVVASDLPAIREYIKHGENGLLVNSENSVALTNTLRTIFNNPNQALVLARAARNTANKYSWQHMLQTILPLFKQ